MQRSPVSCPLIRDTILCSPVIFFVCNMQHLLQKPEQRVGRVGILLNSLTEGIGHFQSIRDWGTIGITFKGIILFWEFFQCYFFYPFQPFLKVVFDLFNFLLVVSDWDTRHVILMFQVGQFLAILEIEQLVEHRAI